MAVVAESVNSDRRRSLMSLVFVYQHARRILQVNFNFKYYSTSTIFGDPKSAEFVAAAASVDSLPRLHGLPEVLTA